MQAARPCRPPTLPPPHTPAPPRGRAYRSPALQPEKLSLYQSQVLNALEHQNDSPGAVSRRKAMKLVYGADSIYARTPTPGMIKSIGRGDVAAYLAKWERPDAAVLGVVGDFRCACGAAVGWVGGCRGRGKGGPGAQCPSM